MAEHSLRAAGRTSHLPPSTRRLLPAVWRDGAWQAGERTVPEEAAVAFTYDGAAHAVMMATPADLEDFAVGFSVTEGIVGGADEIESLEMVPLESGIDLRLWLRADRSAVLAERRRRIAGPVGCGMCGLESLRQVHREIPRVSEGLRVTPDVIGRALDDLAPAQALHRETRAVHAAAFWQPGAGLLFAREDVGRHNALDKLAGALVRTHTPAGSGIVLLTSRASVELVQKAATIGAALLVAVSAPTALALRAAEACGITLVAVARRDGFEVFTHPVRVGGNGPDPWA